MLVKGGSVVALVTPMTDSNDIDYSKLTDILLWHANQGKILTLIFHLFVNISYYCRN